MKIIKNAEIAESSCLGEQNIDFSKKYRPINYSMRVKTDDGLLLYNNLTSELVLLTEDDQTAVDELDLSSNVLKTLIKKWFYVPEEHDDVELCNQVSSFMHLIYDADFYSSDKPITEYTVLTTTDCNARCFYCYEAGRKRISMTEKVAYDAADFIIKSCKGKEVSFRWFGGEPLYNSNAIDIICKKLSDSGIKYKSRMVSNGYLFDDKLIKKAVELWKLENVQVTLDGTEEVYNRCKAYIYNDDMSPYKRVITNIGLLLNAGVGVKVRMNADEHNFEDLFTLTDALYENFGTYKIFKVYSHLIFEDETNKRSEDRRIEVFRKQAELSNYITEKGFSVKYTLKDYLRYSQCMADNSGATVILPDGNLGKCEHFSDSGFWGNIYSSEKNYENIEYFKRTRAFSSECDNCPVRPACIRLENCPDMPKECNELYRGSYIINTENRIKNTYEEHKEHFLYYD